MSDFASLIKKVDRLVTSSVSDEIKLRQSGDIIYQTSQKILANADTLLAPGQQIEVDSSDTQIDTSFSDFLSSLTQASISTGFFVKYLQPQQRKQYHRETVTIESMSAVEAIAELAVGIASFKPDSNLLSDEVMEQAHDENIADWVTLVDGHLQADPQANTLDFIAANLDLTLAQVFIAVLFGDFILEQSDFYNPRSIIVRSR